MKYEKEKKQFKNCVNFNQKQSSTCVYTEMTEHTQGRDAELLCPSLCVELTTPRAVNQCMARMPRPRIKPGLVAPANNPTT